MSIFPMVANVIHPQEFIIVHIENSPKIKNL